MVTQDDVMLMKAAEVLNINYSTAKMIMLKYRNTGKVSEFNRERSNKLPDQGIEVKE